MKKVSFTPPRSPDAVQARFARRVIARLEEGEMPPGVEQRLRFAREQALARARDARLAAKTRTPARRSRTADDAPWWMRLASVLPLALLIGGLTLIGDRYSDAQVEAAAEIDVAILADELPPAAYSDPGFAEYLRSVE